MKILPVVALLPLESCRVVMEAVLTGVSRLDKGSRSISITRVQVHGSLKAIKHR